MLFNSACAMKVSVVSIEKAVVAAYPRNIPITVIGIRTIAVLFFTLTRK